MAQSPTPELEASPEQQILSRPNTSTSDKEASRPKSRGSTTSLQSVGVGNAFQPSQQSQQHDPTMPLGPNGYFMHGPHPGGPIYGPPPEDVLLQYQHNMAPFQQQALEQAAGIGHPPDMRPMSQHAFQEIPPFPMQFPNGMPQYPVPPQHMQHHMRHPSEQFEGSPAPDDSNTENGGVRRRKGTASSLANDQELRRLLAQYQGKSLKEIAVEVQKNEGAGGKSEKAKQVFAMLWLQENCQRSTNSVRRDRVFARYTERCANERVPTLNPASFGKLVRIIFPNVQTRRLGVRGESKYHYVDLSLFPEDDDRQYLSSYEGTGSANGIPDERQSTTEPTTKPFHPCISPPIDRPQSRMATVETANFPAPSAAFRPRQVTSRDDDTRADVQTTGSLKLDCQYANTPIIRLPVKGMATNLVSALPALRPNLPGTMSTYLAMPQLDSLSQTTPSSPDMPIELPDIHPYLAGTNYDPSIATSLYHLYRSYCVDVIDAFRKCKEKPFFNHHSAFNGKMTVPVSKLFSMERLAPWIQECDMRMYKQIVRFIAPLALQNVPDMVWGVFDRIAAKLVGHLIAAFEEKCPVHVVVAKVVPASRFANLLAKLRGANTSTLQLSRLLEDPQQRTQMWLDLMAMVEPERLLVESIPPAESLLGAEGMLRHDLRPLIAPLDDALVRAAENDPSSAYSNFLNEPVDPSSRVLREDVLDQPVGLLEKWINWLERLPEIFQGHHPQCMIDWHSRLWRSVMMQIGQGGAHSYQSWWFVEAFTTQMLGWMTQMEGLLMDDSGQKRADEREQEKSKQVGLPSGSAAGHGTKRKRGEDDVGGDERPEARIELMTKAKKTDAPTPVPPSLLARDGDEQLVADHAVVDEDTDAEMDELRRGGPLDLPSIHTGLSSPIKGQQQQQHNKNNNNNNPANDDSGIDLGLDIDAEAEKEAKKFNKRDWLLSSDPVDGPIGLGVVV